MDTQKETETVTLSMTQIQALANPRCKICNGKTGLVEVVSGYEDGKAIMKSELCSCVIKNARKRQHNARAATVEAKPKAEVPPQNSDYLVKKVVSIQAEVTEAEKDLAAIVNEHSARIQGFANSIVRTREEHLDCVTIVTRMQERVTKLQQFIDLKNVEIASAKEQIATTEDTIKTTSELGEKLSKQLTPIEAKIENENLVMSKRSAPINIRLEKLRRRLDMARARLSLVPTAAAE